MFCSLHFHLKVIDKIIDIFEHPPLDTLLNKNKAFEGESS